MRKITSSLNAILLATTCIGTASAADITTERLLNYKSEPQNWLQVHGDYQSQRHSPLKDINRDNAKNLKPLYITALGGAQGGGNIPQGSFQATPLVVDGFMYVPDGWSTVYKIDLTDPKRGRVVWEMDPGTDKSAVWIAANRGVTLYKDMVVSTTADGKMLWTKMATGELVKSVQVDDPKNGYSLTAPPLLIKDKLILGGSGGDRGARSHIDGLNADTGAPIWRQYTVPKPGEPGSETWKDKNNAWEHGGGAYWQTGSYDPETNVTIWGSGQPVPMYDPEYRPGDNLFTNSSIAYDVDTGERKWYFQYTPGDAFDYDEVGSQMILDLNVGGQSRKTLVHFSRNGFLYTLDRARGQFINAGQYASKVNWTAGIDPKTGKPVEYDPSKDLQTYKIGSPAGRRAQGTINLCPNIQGGVNYFPTSYSPVTGLVYGAGIEGCQDVKTDEARSGGKVAWNGGLAAANERVLGSITAMDPATGQRKGQKMFDYASYSGVLSTAGGLVFTTSIDGTVYALDDKTMDVLWTFNVGTLSQAPPVSYSVNGKQYVAVVTGGRVTSMLAKSPELSGIKNSTNLVVFGL